eukprot:CAMPEP_0197943804 /NCGR_PEP_ID=MMETSP1439-20131203/125094_1 /TAXON_ID=66791 /ORGANISM="Gonyaulax spinifera, Strain CCMP409" /LENGTH=458 /DNA_ID=CAMNT_0043567059 /DNA_START=71 /DNA_END=1447 /DNA_ORIENTATION=-
MAPEPAAQARFVNAIPNDCRYKKTNRVGLDVLCETAYRGDFQAFEAMLSSGDEDSIFNGDVNMHYTDVNALHMAAIAGNEDCVKLLLEAKADPHVKTVVPVGKDPEGGQTARDKAAKFKHQSIVELLKQAEQDYQATPAPEASSQPSLPVALLFPGQGSQCVGMIKGVQDLDEVKDMLAKAGPILGYDLLELCLNGPEDKLEQTKFCQPAMFVGGLAGVAKLRKDEGDKVARARCMAGLSLGEYTALCAAGVLSFEDGLKLVKIRGEAMQEAAAASRQSMVSVAGLERTVLDDLCSQAAKAEGAGAVCQVANVLFPKGFSCAGTEKAIHNLKELAEIKGALQAKVLKTSGGFHTSLMQPAQEKLKVALDSVLPNMKPPRCAVYMNVNAEPLPAGTDPKVIVELLNKQLVSPVLWCPLVQKMIADGVTEFFECGPQKQIKSMMKRIDPKVGNKTTSTEI